MDERGCWEGDEGEYFEWVPSVKGGSFSKGGGKERKRLAVQERERESEQHAGSLLRLPAEGRTEVLINYSFRRRQGHSNEGLDLSWPLRSRSAAR